MEVKTEWIKSRIRIHDRFSVVIDVTYDKLFDRKKPKYTTVTYIFIPDSLNIHKRTYPDSKFYNDVRLFLKYDTPKYSLNDIDKSEGSLLQNLSLNAEKYLNRPTEKNRLIFKDQAKMFSGTYSHIIRKEVDNLIRKEKLTEDEVSLFLERLVEILEKYRKLVKNFRQIVIKKRYKNVVFHADEHISNVLEHHLMRLYNNLKTKKKHKKNLQRIINLIDSEQKYRKQKGYFSPKDKKLDAEKLLYKKSMIKKYIESVFFLHQDIRKDGTIWEQTLLMLAAGLAMVFSTGVAFYYQQTYGNFTYPFFIALVVSYMLKDRIKGLIGMLFVSKSNSLFYDFKIRVKNGLGEKIGIIKEDFMFIPLRKLDDAIRRIRLLDRLVGVTEESLNEHVIQYKKKIEIYPGRFKDDLPDKNINGITDVTRLNFSRYILYMDDPKKEYILVKKGEIFKKMANKVYHINIVQKYFTKEGVAYSRYRVIMSRDGIKRLEKIETDEISE